MIEKLSSPEIQKFIRDHEHHDPFQLVLKAKQYADLPIKEIAGQIRARQKARTKLPQWYQTEGIVYPELLSMEQCSSDTTAHYKAELLQGQRLVDLTGGSGVDTFYMGQSFERVDYVEQNKDLSKTTAHNLRLLGASHITIHHAQAEQFLQDLSAPVDCIYLDPARRDENAQKVFRLEDCTPDVILLKQELLAKSHNLLIKTAPMLDIELAVRALENVCQVHIIAVNNECKEVLYWLRTSPAKEETPVTAINFHQGKRQVFTFTREQEAQTEAAFSEPLAYLYEPHAGIMKAGAFKLIGQAYGIYKLHPQTHLYTSDQLIPDFPGRVFQCEQVVSYNKKEVKKNISSKKANISVRNFPATVPQAKKKLELKDGGDYYIFLATTLSKPSVIITRKAL